MTRRPPRAQPLALALGAAVALALAAPGLAAAAPSCSLATAGIAFGAYNPLATAPADAAGTIRWTCPGVTYALVTLSRGAAASFTPRTMVRGAEALAYNVYTDAARTTVFGDWSGGTSGLLVTGGGQPQTATVYGRVLAGQDVSAGAYSDVLTLTFIF